MLNAGAPWLLLIRTCFALSDILYVIVTMVIEAFFLLIDFVWMFFCREVCHLVTFFASKCLALLHILSQYSRQLVAFISVPVFECFSRVWSIHDLEI